jgi:transglutaminase-like putative cysteine protease
MATRSRLLAPLALAALSVSAALSVGRVFDSSRYVLPVVGAALLPHAVGAVGRRWRWAAPLVLLAGALVLLAYVVWAIVPSTTSAIGLPGSATWHAIGHDLRTGWQALRTKKAPAPASEGAILLAVLAVWAMATTADWLAFTRRAVLGAMAPALVIFVWSSVLGTHEFPALGVAAFIVFAGMFLYAQNLALLDQRRSWLVTRSRARGSGLIGIACLGAAALVAALVLAPALPGADADAILHVQPGDEGTGGHTYQAGIAPLVDVGAKLQNANVPDLFTVKADQPDYWRVTALDQYSPANGGEWTLDASGPGAVQSGLDAKVPPGALHQVYDIGPKLGERWMPAAYQAVRVSTPDILVVTSSATLVTDDSSVSGLTYTVDSVPGPRDDQVTAAQEAATDAPLPRSMRKYTDLPATFPQDIRNLAQTIVTRAGATTPYQKAAALRDYFRGPQFTYDTHVDYSDSAQAIEQFLQVKRGFCVQFASAYAVMARAVGLPTRLATGFTPGTLRDGEYVVDSHDTHAWPEVWLAGLGWTHLFDPTPPSNANTVGGSALPGEAGVAPITAVGPETTVAPPQATTAPTPSTTPGAAPPAAGGGNPPASTAPAATPKVSEPASSGGNRSPWMFVALVVLVISGIVGAYVAFVVVAKQRRRARRRTGDPGAAVQGAWDEAIDRLREAHQQPDPALTAIEMSRVTPAIVAPATAAPMRALARTYTATRYGDQPAAEHDADQAWASLEALERALDDSVSGRERWRRKLDVSTLRKPTRV